MRRFLRALLLTTTLAAPALADEVRQRAGDPAPPKVVPQISLIKIKVASVVRSGSGPIASRNMDVDFVVKNSIPFAFTGTRLLVETEANPVKKLFDLTSGPSDNHVIVSLPTPSLCAPLDGGYLFRFETTDTDHFETEAKVVHVDTKSCVFAAAVEDPWLSMAPDNAAPLLASNVHVSAFTVDHAPVCGQNLAYHATVANPSSTNGSVMLRIFDSDGVTTLAHHGPFAVPPHQSVKVSFASIFPGHAGKLSLRIEEVNKAIPATDIRYGYAITASSCKVDFAAPVTRLSRGT